MPDLDQILRDYHGWLYKTAISLVGSSSPYLDDLVQEGRIAMWRALETYNPKRGLLEKRLTFKARSRMVDIVDKNRSLTGQPSRRKGREGISEPDTISLDKERGEGVTLLDLIPSPDILVNLSTDDKNKKEQDVAQALDNLTDNQRKFILAKFWDNTNEWSMKEIFGYSPSPKMREGAYKKLRKELAHLESTVE